MKPGDSGGHPQYPDPGTTREIILPILEQSGLKAGNDSFLAYSSERIAEGRAFMSLKTCRLR